MQKKLTYLSIFGIILLIIDQITKIYITVKNINVILIPNVLELQTVENTGGAFGIGEGNTIMFIITNIIVLGIIIRFICKQKEMMNNITLCTLYTILAGGFGNVIDRILRGYVVDFISIFPSTNFPKFNFADIYITIGWIMLMASFTLYSYREIKNNRRLKG